jgi:hypothetical protein
MAHTARWRCPGCGRELGTALGPTLTVDPEQVVQVVVTPRGTAVTCAGCRAERFWSLKRGA